MTRLTCLRTARAAGQYAASRPERVDAHIAERDHMIESTTQGRPDALVGSRPASSPTKHTTVVFVDDERVVLQAIAHATRPWHDVWDIHFVESGGDAIELFDRLHVDVLVTDSDLVGVSAGELLAEVRRRSPQTARVVTSRPGDRESVLQVIGAAHQYLAKPVDVEAMADVIEHIRSATGQELRDPVRTLIGQVDRLPSPPALFQRLTAMMATDDWTIDGIAIEIAQDVALTGEILKLANSSFFGTTERVTSISRAISLVGADLIRFVVLGKKLFQSGNSVETWLDLEGLERRSNNRAHGARALAVRDKAPSELCAASYLAGMVAEIGLLVMARVPDISASIAQPLNGGIYPGAERAIFGGDRFEVGCRLLQLWGFGNDVVDAIARLGSDDVRLADGLPWYLFAAGRLVVDQGFDPRDLVAGVEAGPAVDEALDLLRGDAEGVAVSAA